MGNLVLNGQTVLEQVGTARPEFGAGFPSGTIVNYSHYNTGYDSGAQNVKTTNAWEIVKIGGTNFTGARGANNNTLLFNKKYNTTNVAITCNFPFYVHNGNQGFGLRLNTSFDNQVTFNLVDIIPDGFSNTWGAGGYGGHSAGVVNFIWNTSDNNSINSTIKNFIGNLYFYFEMYLYNTADSLYLINYGSNSLGYKYGTVQIQEILE